MSIDISIFRQAFFEESAEQLDEFERNLLQMEQDPTDKELLNSIFRCAHSIKGGSATFGFPAVAGFTHSLETLLDNVRNGRILVDSDLSKLLLESLDHMRVLIAVSLRDDTDMPDSSLLIARIEEACKTSTATGEPVGGEATNVPSATEELYRLEFKPNQDCFRSGNDPLRILGELQKGVEVTGIKCHTSGIPTLEDMDPESCYLAWTATIISSATRSEILEPFEFVASDSFIDLQLSDGFFNGFEEDELPTNDVPPPAAISETKVQTDVTASANKDGGTIKVSSEKLDKLINLVGELIISQSMLNSVTQELDTTKLVGLTEAVSLMERSSRELQEQVMGLRLLQIKMAFGRFPRLVHDLASSCGKKVELRLSGEETELDKNLIEAIGDPLTHLVRNSVDHGLESPEERLNAGKPAIGVLSISAFHEGGSITIEVADDGRGLSVQRILAKAIERGLVSPDDNLSEDQICNLIFQPGFSTTDQVTDLSGRGVGMDIVNQAIAGIGGSVKVTSVAGQGVSTKIRLPLTMAILEGQLMAVGDSVFIIPLTSIVECIRPQQGDMHNVAQSGEVVKVREDFLPVMRLHRAFAMKPRVAEPWEGSMVLVESEGSKVAVMVDELLGQSQVVIKSLETNYQKVEGIAGATILGDGRVALIVDVPGLVRGFKGQMKNAA